MRSTGDPGTGREGSATAWLSGYEDWDEDEDPEGGLLEMGRGTELTNNKFIARAFRGTSKQDGFSVGSRTPWAEDAEVPETRKRRYYFQKREDPERMSMRSLREALCSYAGPKGKNCERCALCAYGRNWVRRSKDEA